MSFLFVKLLSISNNIQESGYLPGAGSKVKVEGEFPQNYEF